MSSKIIDFNELEPLVKRLTAHNDYKIGLCHGCFDVLHSGHIYLFKQAKEQCDILFVTITADKFITKPNSPINNEHIRTEILSKIEDVDYVSIVAEKTGIPIIDLIHPALYFKGSDTSKDGGMVIERQAVEKYNGQVVYIDCLPNLSGTSIKLNDEQREFIKLLPDANTIISYVDRLNNKSVYLLGETIVDEYVSVRCLDKAPKTSILATQFVSERQMIGATSFTARIVKEFTDVAGMFTNNNNIIRKRRYIDHSFAERDQINVLFEVCYGDAMQTADEEDYICKQLQGLVCITEPMPLLVMDFGHGLITKRIWRELYTDAGCIWLGVVCQTNESNLGFNLATKYKPFADYICIDEYELRLAMQDNVNTLKVVAERFHNNCKSDSVLTVTSGGGGTWLVANDKTVHVPAMPARVIDRIGAGDAFFAMSALAIYHKLPLEVAGFLGNVAGAIKVTSVGTEGTVTKEAVKDYIRRLVK